MNIHLQIPKINKFNKIINLTNVYHTQIDIFNQQSRNIFVKVIVNIKVNKKILYKSLKKTSCNFCIKMFSIFNYQNMANIYSRKIDKLCYSY